MKTQKILLAINTVLLAAILVFVILIYLCMCRNNNLSTEVDSLKKELQSAKKSVDFLQGEMVFFSEANKNLSVELDSLKDRVSELEKCCEKKHNAAKMLQSENKNLRVQINVLRDSLDKSLIPVTNLVLDTLDSEIADTVSADTLVAARHVIIQVMKTLFLKNGSEQTTLLNYSADVNFYSLSGFSKDSLNENYIYSDENRNKSVFYFKSLIAGNSISFKINQNENILLSENKEFYLPLEAGGLQTYENVIPNMDLNWTSPIFMESTFDSKKYILGKIECIAGPVITAAGGFGLVYYTINPSVEVNVYKGDKLIGTDKTFNKPMIFVSGAVTLGGIILTIKGVSDKNLSWTLTPAGISAKYTIE